MFQVPCSNEGLIFHSNLFTDNQRQEAVFENCIKSEERRKEICLRTIMETMAVSNFLRLIFRVK